MPSTVDQPDEERVDGRDARWAAHRHSRRSELVKAARRAVHHHGPEISMDDLAAEMGTSKSIIYRYFTDKSGLQGAVGSAVLEDLRGALEAVTEQVIRPRERIAAMVGVYVEVVATSPAVYAFVTRAEAPATAGEVRGFVAEVEDIVTEAGLAVVRPRGGHGEAVEARAAVGARGEVRGLLAEVEDIVAESLLAVLRPRGDHDEADEALAALRAAGVVGLVRATVERWIAARTSADRPDRIEGEIAAKDRDELTTRITDWLWEGAAGVARRARHDRTRTERHEHDHD